MSQAAYGDFTLFLNGKARQRSYERGSGGYDRSDAIKHSWQVLEYATRESVIHSPRLMADSFLL